MKKKITALIAALVAVSILAGCTTIETEDKSSNPEKTSRFVLIEKGRNWQVMYDRETKVMYVVSNGSYNHGTFTLLVDQNGNPLLYEEDDVSV